MAGQKLSPRQKMIGMMYLVLTALLALNISKDVLKAFSKINGSLYKTNTNFSEKNNEVYAQFEQAALTNPKKSGPFKEKAFLVKSNADQLNLDLQRLKYDMVAKADGKVSLLVDGQEVIIEKGVTFDQLSNKEKMASFSNIKRDKDRQTSWEIMGDDGGQNQGSTLQNNLEKFKELMISFTSENQSIVNSLNATFNFSNVEKNKAGGGKGLDTWNESNFKQMPLIAAVTILTKIQSDVRNAEADVINFLLQDIDATSLKFTGAEGLQIAPSNYIFTGDTFKADVFIAAKDSTQNPTIYVGDYELSEDGTYKMSGQYDTIPVKRGKGKYAIRTRTQGYKKWGGLIEMKTDDGVKLYPFNGEYLVAEKSVVISPTKMNVFYLLGDKIGNPVDISVPGVPKDKIFVSCNNGKIVKKGQSWEVFPRTRKNATISITAEINGKRKSMGSMEFRVKTVPDPVPTFTGLSKEKKIGKGVLGSGQVRMKAELKSFDFDYKFKITSFTMTYEGNAGVGVLTTRGSRLSADMISAVNGSRSGSKLYFSAITAKGDDGKPRRLSDLIVTLK